MNYEINKQLSKSGKRAVYFPTIEGVRINRVNFTKKWEAKELAKSYLLFIAKKAE